MIWAFIAFITQLFVFFLFFRIGMALWSWVTAEGLDRRIRQLMNRLLRDNPVVKEFDVKLEANTQALVKQEGALEHFRKEWLAKSDALLESERRLSGLDTSLMLKTGELNDLKGILQEKSDLASDLERKVGAARRVTDAKELHLARTRGAGGGNQQDRQEASHAVEVATRVPTASR